MKAGEKLSEIAERLEKQVLSKRDFVAPTRQLEIREDGAALRVNGKGTFPLRELAHQQIAQRVEIPQKYYDRMRKEAPALLARNVNHWFQSEPEARMVRTLDGEARAFLSRKYRPLDNVDMAEAILPVLAGTPGLRIESAALTDSRLYIKAISERVTFEVRKGDIVQAGIVVSNSEVGLGSVKVEPLIFRLACLNGMISQDYSLSKYHVGRGHDGGDLAEDFFRDETRLADDRAFWLKAQDTVRGALSSDVFGKIAGKLQKSTEKPIEGDVVEVVERVQARYQLTEQERGGVLSHLIKGGDLTQYGLIQAITATSQEVKDYDRATELERLGGVVLELPGSEWVTLGGKAREAVLA